MHRFYVPEAQTQDALFEISGREAHHAATVLRLGPGDDAIVLDGVGGVSECKVADARRNRLVLEVFGSRKVPRPVCAVTLLQALPKGRIIEDIIQKAVELGAARVIPLVTERVVTRLHEDDAARKAEKWQQVAIEAIKQSGNPWLTKIEMPVTPQQFLSKTDQAELCLVGSLQPGSRHPRIYFDQFRQKHSRSPGSVFVWVGPEGDFTVEEINALLASGALPITLGPLVLRVETAAVFCLAIIAYELGADMGK